MKLANMFAVARVDAASAPRQITVDVWVTATVFNEHVTIATDGEAADATGSMV